ncbi:MAG TPA: TrmH family RNA methyltransferase [Rectinemataceae bacterium]
MIEPEALSKLGGAALGRKCALLAEEAERAARASAEALGSSLEYAGRLASFIAEFPRAPGPLKAAALGFLGSEPGLRSLNAFKHDLRKASGQSSADWDLADPRPSAHGCDARRPVFHGLRVYLEDLRSPFNVGTIFRTAEAFGFEEILLSPDCADPLHPRASRSSMGLVQSLPWRRCTREELGSLGPMIALELGGIPLGDFIFPPGGTLLLGSEELGLSQPLLDAAGPNRLSIPMIGRKASLNVAVAFGIAAQAWSGALLAGR